MNLSHHEIEEFSVQIPEADIYDLRKRLGATRYPPVPNHDDRVPGFSIDLLKHWVDRWASFDHGQMQGKLNSMQNFVVELGGQKIHFILQEGRGPAAKPLLLTHGWPWTYWDWNDVVGPLSDPERYGGDASDSFDVIVPSLPGFAFSTPLINGGMDHGRVARLWLQLMTEVLGYDRFFAAGGDHGNIITAILGHAYPERLLGIHLFGAVPLEGPRSGTGILGQEWEADWGFERPQAPPTRKIAASSPTSAPSPPSSHRVVHMRDAQTIAASLHDSPAGMMAWILKPRYFWRELGNGLEMEDSFSEEFLLTTCALYWFTNSVLSSIRIYQSVQDSSWLVHTRNPRVEVPTGITFFEFDQTSRSRFWVEGYYNIVRLGYSEVGGHFAPAEQPRIVVDEIRKTARLCL